MIDLALREMTLKKIPYAGHPARGHRKFCLTDTRPLFFFMVTITPNFLWKSKLIQLLTH